MDDTPSPETPAPSEPGLNKIDLTQLQGFSFGTQWTQDKSAPGESRRGDERPRREERREGAPTGVDRRDRRAFRKPQGDQPSDANAPAGGPGMAPGMSRQGGGEFRGGPRRDFRGGPRREGPGGGERGEYRGERGGRFGHGGPQERGPYDSPYFMATFYPEDVSFTTLAKTIRSSCRTIELFEIARTVIAKPDRFVVVMQRKAPATPPAQPAPAPAEGAASPESNAPAVPGVKPAPLYISVPDGIPFETEDAAITHVLQHHVGLFFDVAEVEVEPPKGNFQIINRCSITGELLGPPNYHRYNQIVQQHFATRISRMPFDVYRSRIDSVRDPEVVNQWLQKMKKVTRYTWKLDRPAAAPAPAPIPAPAPAPADGATAESAAPAPAEGSAASPEAVPVVAFDSIDEARTHLLTNAREKVLRTAENARFHGRLVEQIPPGEIRRAIEGTLERQRRFPLDTANALRGRLRREGFTIFKKGSKGISYVCAVKRKFRVPGQTFAESINALISFIEAHPMAKAGELPAKFLGIEATAKPAVPAQETAVSPGAEGEVSAVTPAAPAAATPPAADVTPELREKFSRMQGDLLWLVREGYVTEFIDGRLFAPPPMVEARKKEVESEDHDPENFPEAPPEPPAPAPAVASEVSAPPPADSATPSEPAAEPNASGATEAVTPPVASEPPPAPTS